MIWKREATAAAICTSVTQKGHRYDQQLIIIYLVSNINTRPVSICQTPLPYVIANTRDPLTDRVKREWNGRVRFSAFYKSSFLTGLLRDLSQRCVV